MFYTKNPKILLLTRQFPPDIGGVPNYFYNLVLNLKATDVIVIARLMKDYANSDKLLEEKGIRIKRVDYYPSNMNLQISINWFICMFKMVSTIVKIVNTDKVDYVVVGQSSIFLTFVVYIVKMITRRPYILFLHGEEIPQICLRSNGLRRYLYCHAFAYFCISEFTKRRLVKFIGNRKLKIKILSPGVEDRFFDDIDISDIKKKLKIDGKRVIYTIARLDERKGQDMVIESLPLVVRTHPEIIYIIGGEGPRLNYLKDLVEKKFLSDYVRFLGLVSNEEIVYYHHVGEIFIMPNRTLEDGDTEGFGIVFLEANAVGNPVIGGRAGGTVHAIVDGITGFLVNSNDLKDIANKICWLLENKDKADEMGRRGREKVWVGSRWSSIAEEFRGYMVNLV
ncbi:MAG: glycosyltransferase family 4 protein [Actinomycetota bacterium]